MRHSGICLTCLSKRVLVMKRALAIAVLVVPGLSASASAGWYTTDAGCSALLSAGGTVKKVFWNGKCADGQISGPGELHFLVMRQGELINFRYSGDTQDGRMQGRGTLLYADGHKYTGEWKNNKRHGWGVMEFSNGDRYEGQWRNNLRSGKGTYAFADGARYEGHWKSGRQDGSGTIHYPQGGKFQGTWSGGKRHGPGTTVSLSGEREEEIWQYGRRQQPE